MTRSITLPIESLAIGLAGTLLLGACSGAEQPQPVERSGASDAGTPAPPVETGRSQPSAPEATPGSGAPPGYTDGQGINEGYPDLTPVPLSPDLERTATGARNVLIPFARAIELREYDQAWAMMGPAARAQWTKARFNGLFDGLSKITVAVPDGTMEGAAGSSYYTSQADITATDADGRPVAISGPIVLRRVNDVPGASAEQLHWRIESVDLAWTH